MNYPMWGVPAAGLAIACVAILHVFVSHFAIGGGLFLVLTERKARRDGDAALLSYVRSHSRFFAVLTLVLGAITGVGVWFTIGLVHPQATASLINTFVWLWAVEWTMFATEIAASMVYYYGWDRLDARTHQRVGWIYFWAAWLSLVVINGILSFMLTPGAWLTSRRVLDGFLNPTNLPSMAGRTFAAVGLAGVYALLTASWLKDRDLKARVARYAGLRWIAPMAVALPLSLVWYLSAASSSGVPVREILGSRGDGLGAQTIALFSATTFGYPIARHAAAAGLVGSALALLLTLAIVRLRPRSFGPLAAGAVMAAGFVAVGGAEWTREDLPEALCHRAVHVRQWHPRAARAWRAGPHGGSARGAGCGPVHDRRAEPIRRAWRVAVGPCGSAWAGLWWLGCRDAAVERAWRGSLPARVRTLPHGRGLSRDSTARGRQECQHARRDHRTAGEAGERGGAASIVGRSRPAPGDLARPPHAALRRHVRRAG